MHRLKEAGCHKAVPDVREQEASLKHPSVGMALAFTFSCYTPCPQALSLHKTVDSQHHFNVPFRKYLLYNFSNSYQTTALLRQSLQEVWGCRQLISYVRKKWIISTDEEASRMLQRTKVLALDAGDLSLVPETHAKVERTDSTMLSTLSSDLNTLTPSTTNNVRKMGVSRHLMNSV